MPRGYKNPPAPAPAPKATKRVIRPTVSKLTGDMVVPIVPPVAGFIDWGAEAHRQPQNSGLAVDYYLCPITNPHRPDKLKQGIVECGDIIEALGMTFNEGTAFKAIWRKAAERTLGLQKAGNDAKRDAQKVKFYGSRMLSEITGKPE